MKLKAQQTNQGIMFILRETFGENVKIEIEENISQTTLDGKEEKYDNKQNMARQRRGNKTSSGKRKDSTSK